MSTALTETPKATGLRGWMARPEIYDQLVAAVGDAMDPDQFIAHAMVSLQASEFQNCTDESKFRAMHEMCALAVLPVTGQVALIVRGKPPKVQKVSVMTQWQGYKAIMERHPAVLEISAYLVHVADSFLFENGDLQHIYDPFDPARKIEGPGDLKGGYCKITYTDGRPPKYHTVTIAHITKCRGCAKTQDIWTPWYEQMAMKTLYRDCYARRAAPVDPLVATRMEKMLKIEDVNMGNDPMRVSPSNTESHVEQAKAAREAAAKAAREAAADPPLDPPEHPPLADTEPTAPETDGEPKPDVHPTPTQIKNAETMSQRIADIATPSNIQAIEADIATALADGLLAKRHGAELNELLGGAKTRFSET